MRRLEGGVERAVERGLRGEEPLQLGLGLGALVAGQETIRHFGAQLVDLIVDGEHRSLGLH